VLLCFMNTDAGGIYSDLDSGGDAVKKEQIIYKVKFLSFLYRS